MPRIAKIIARSGFCSRRQAEELVAEKRVSFNDEIIQEPSFCLDESDHQKIKIDGVKLPKIKKAEIWLFHKPKNCLTSRVDEKNLRKTIFDILPKYVPKISVGRLDFNTEGLLLLTNDGALARFMELPQNALKRTYKVKIFGQIEKEALGRMQKIVSKEFKVDSVKYAPMEMTLIHSSGSQAWLEVSIFEGKNREVRKIFEHFGFKVSRLIRISYGEFELLDLKIGDVKGPLPVPDF